MNLIKRPNSRFWYVQFQIDGRTFVRSTKTTDKRAAERVAAKIRAEAHNAVIGGCRSGLSLDEALERFIASKFATPNYANLVSIKRSVLRLVDGTLLIEHVTSDILEEFGRKRLAEGCKPQTVKHGLNCIVGALRKAKRDGYACPSIEPPTVKVANKRVRYLSSDEERRLLAELDPAATRRGLPRDNQRRPECRRWLQDGYDLVVLLLDTGARYGEIANMRWDQVDLADRSIRLWRSKVENESIIYMSDRAARVFERRQQVSETPFVFRNKVGLSRGYSATGIRKAMLRAELSDCTIHTLRHTHASRLIQNGLTVYEVKTVLGHADIRTTMRYAHLEHKQVTQRARDVINALNAQVSH